MSHWNKSHWNDKRIEVPKTLTIPQQATVLFTNDESRTPLCVIWKQDGSDIYHVRGLTDVSHEVPATSIRTAVDYAEQLLEALKGELG